LQIFGWKLRIEEVGDKFVVNDRLFNPALSFALMLASFVFMIWPGYALLHLIGLGRHPRPPPGGFSLEKIPGQRDLAISRRK
jgi:hypothetical protein